MKTTSKTIFGLLTASFVLAVGSQSWAQSTPPEKPMRPNVLKILCAQFPLNSRCPQGGSTSESMPAPTSNTAGSPTTPTSPKNKGKTPVPVGPSGGGVAPLTSPKGEMMPAAPGSTMPASPSSGGTETPMTPASPSSPNAPAVPVGPSGGGTAPLTSPK